MSFYYFFFFSSTKWENRRVEQVLREEVVTSGKGGRVNMVQKLCTHVCKCKNPTLLKLFQKCGGKGNKGEQGRG
jgi:hypothetical protein